MLVVVGRIGRPHGVRGEVTVEVRTDVPDIRFAPGSVLIADPATSGPLTVSGHRWHSGRLLVTIEGVRDRNAAEGLRGVVLSADVAADDIADDPEEYYDHQLRGLTAVDPTGAVLGVVEDVIHLPGQDLLAIALSDGAEALAAVRAALAMRSSLERLNGELAAAGLPSLRQGIGLHFGEVIAGNLGSSQRLEFTVIGASVNVASRLEGLTRRFPDHPILISGSLLELLGDVVDVEPLGEHSLKGWPEPVAVYGLIGLHPAAAVAARAADADSTRHR